MKLKYIDINGYGVLVDESAEIKEGDYWIYICPINGLDYGDNNQPIVRNNLPSSWYDKLHDKNNYYKIIFAEKELNLDVPILPNWRDFEIEQLAEILVDRETNASLKSSIRKQYERYVKIGLNHNKAKYTEEDLEKAINMAKNSKNGFKINKIIEPYSNNEIIQSLQKVPKYIVMETVEHIHPDLGKVDETFKFTNSEGKQEGIIKEIIY